MRATLPALLVLSLAPLRVGAAPPPRGGAPSPGDPAATRAPRPELRTTAETTRWRRTGRYDEVERLCRAYAEAWPARVRCVTFGATLEGRPLLALVASDDGALDGATARARRRPVVVFQGGIHPGEIDGKDAGFVFLRDVLEGRAAPGALARLTAVFIPVLNPDGHERFGPNHRPNQVGPEETGWRTTAANLNLNRDFAKVEAPETRALLALLDEWDPIVYVDLHVTDGAELQHELAYLVEPRVAGDPRVRRAASALREAARRELARAGHRPIVDFYPSFVKDDDPRSGFEVYAAYPRLGTSYWSIRNRLGVLVELHSWKPYATRVRACREALRLTFVEAARSGADWAAAARAADADAAAGRLAGAEVALDWEPTGASRTIRVLGYRYERRPSEVSGSTWIRYDRRRPEVWEVPLFEELKPKTTVRAPAGGYLVPPGHAAWLAAKLDAHGLRYARIDRARAGLAVETWRAETATFRPTPYEGRQRLDATGAWRPERRDVPARSLFVPLAQPRAALALHLLEPSGPDSLLHWGFFNAHFERKEYMEGYVAEAVARELLKDPAVKAEFERRLAADPAFAASAEARLEFFYRRHPSWDERLGLYPIYRIAAAP